MLQRRSSMLQARVYTEGAMISFFFLKKKTKETRQHKPESITAQNECTEEQKHCQHSTSSKIFDSGDSKFHIQYYEEEEFKMLPQCVVFQVRRLT
jgi:hypothetical protein